MLAAQHGKVCSIKKLLDRGAHINEKSNIGYTPVMIAMCNGHPDCVVLLIDRGADMQELDARSRSEGRSASNNGNT